MKKKKLIENKTNNNNYPLKHFGAKYKSEYALSCTQYLCQVVTAGLRPSRNITLRRNEPCMLQHGSIGPSSAHGKIDSVLKTQHTHTER